MEESESSIDCSVLARAKSPRLDSSAELFTSFTFVIGQTFYARDFMIEINRRTMQNACDDMAETPTFRRSQELLIPLGTGKTPEMAWRWLPKALLLLSFGFILSSSAIAQNNVVGEWSPVMTWPYEAIHAHVLSTGKVLFWTRADHSQFWDPANNTITSAAGSGANIFCSGHAFLSDGKLLVAGGHVSSWVGLPSAYIYSQFNGTWTQLPDMNNGRWYPTNITLPNGDVLVVSGWVNTTVGVNVEPQVWQAAAASWRDLTGAHLALPFYPFMFVAPNGKVF